MNVIHLQHRQHWREDEMRIALPFMVTALLGLLLSIGTLFA